MKKKLELYKKYLILSESLDLTEKEFAEKQIKILNSEFERARTKGLYKDDVEKWERIGPSYENFEKQKKEVEVAERELKEKLEAAEKDKKEKLEESEEQEENIEEISLSKLNEIETKKINIELEKKQLSLRKKKYVKKDPKEEKKEEMLFVVFIVFVFLFIFLIIKFIKWIWNWIRNFFSLSKEEESATIIS